MSNANDSSEVPSASDVVAIIEKDKVVGVLTIASLAMSVGVALRDARRPVGDIESIIQDIKGSISDEDKDALRRFCIAHAESGYYYR